MAVTTFNASTGGDGALYYQGIGSDWSTARGAASATTGPQNPHVYGVQTERQTNQRSITRTFFTFLTGNILKNAVSIQSATLSLYGYAAYSNPLSMSVCLVGSTQTDPASLALGDYSKFATTEFASRIAFSSWNQSGYNDFSLNASGISALNLTAGGYSKFCIRISADVDNSEPGSNGDNYVGCYYQEDADSNKYPKLTVTYTIASSAFFNFL
jgi:hypothetical protein